jgi:hypothetical protein
VKTWTAVGSLEEALEVVLRSISQTSFEPLEEVAEAASLEVADAEEAVASLVDLEEVSLVVVSPVEVASMTISTLVVVVSVVLASPLALVDLLLLTNTSTNAVVPVAEVDNKNQTKGGVLVFVSPQSHTPPSLFLFFCKTINSQTLLFFHRFPFLVFILITVDS